MTDADAPWKEPLDATTRYVETQATSEFGNAMSRCIHEEGTEFSGPYETHEAGAGMYTTNGNLSQRHHRAITEFLEAFTPMPGECYTNAFHLWDAIEAATYVEGYAFSTSGAGVMEHAWNTIDSTLVDVTLPCEAYVGVPIDETTARRCFEIGVEQNEWGVFENWADDHQFLREKGYL